MEDKIAIFHTQFSYKPEIVHKESLAAGYKNFVIGGMGGSHLCAGILQMYKPGGSIYIHRDYGTPHYDKEFCRDTLFIASSYSGNTEETYDFLDDAYSQGFDVCVVTTGGKLLSFAVENKIPHIVLPTVDIQPRLAVGYTTIALASIIYPGAVEELQTLVRTLKPNTHKENGAAIAATLSGKIPIIYTSLKNRPLAYNWKIKLNETGKIPAFYNSFPELNHNEMQGYDNQVLSHIGSSFHFIFIKDKADHERVATRMDVLQRLLEEKGYGVTTLYLEGDSRFEKIFNSLILADWVSVTIARTAGVDPERVPLIEEFKKRII